MSGEDNWGEPTANGGGDVRGGRTPSPSGRRDRSPPPRQEEDRGRAPAPVGGNPGNNLHVSSLSNRVTEADLESAFGQYGTVMKAQVMRDPHTRDPRGFAFVTMASAEEAEAAIQALNATDLQGKLMTVEKARRGRARTPTPGAYHGPPKREPYGGGRDSRYDDRDSYRGGGGDRRGGYDDRRGGDRYDDRGYDSRRDDRGYSYAAPMRDDRDRGRSSYDDRRGGGGGGGYDDRRSSRYDDYDRRRY